jgi:signal transduction histidine kinase
VLARGRVATPYSQADLSLAQALALRAASALDNARLFDLAQRAIRARDEVLGVVSHDLRTPLSVISMCVGSVLADEELDHARTRERMTTVRESLDWADGLIRDLLDVSAIEAGGLSLTRRREDPVLLVSREVHRFEPLAAPRSITLRTELPEHLPEIDADAERIMQALGNLIGNALKFTPTGGEIRVGAVRDGDSVRFFVSDSGPGVPEEDVAHVFDRFWTARRTSRTRGTGMGLAIVRGIVEAHGGRAWVEPRAESGATFMISLRVAPPPAATED